MILALTAVAFLTLNGGEAIPCWVVKKYARIFTEEQLKQHAHNMGLTPEQIRAARKCLSQDKSKT